MSDSYKLTIMKDGQWREVGCFEQSGDKKDYTKRAPMLMPFFYFPSDTKSFVGGGKHYITGFYSWSGHMQETVNNFLDMPLLGEKYPFDFENHTYKWAYGNGKKKSGNYLWRQVCGSDINPADLKKCRKKYSHDLIEIPTWRSLLTELFGQQIFNYILTTEDVYIWRKVAYHNRKVGKTANDARVWRQRQLKITIPVSSSDKAEIWELIKAGNISIKNKRRNTDLATNDANLCGSASLYLVKDVTSFERTDGQMQYIPGDIIFRFAMSFVGFTTYQHTGIEPARTGDSAITIVIDCESLPGFYFPSGSSYDFRNNFRLSTLKKYYVTLWNQR